MNSERITSQATEEEIHGRLCSVFNLTQNEARLYISMLQNEFYTASELSELSGIHRSRIYDNLKGLEAKKLVQSTDQNPLRFKLIPPKEAVAHISNALISEHKSQLREISELGILLDIEIQKRSEMSVHRPQILPLENAILELRDLLRSTKRRVWVTKRTSGGLVDWFSLRAELGKLLSEGIDIRFLSDRPIGFPFDLRVRESVSVSFAIIDDTTVSFLIPSDADNDGQLFITRNKEYLRFYEDTFLRWWSNSP
ncbi:MAG: TrmB family transcriptional regulator [Candidatus Thorarchaeota archaeon]